jgi:hypothetical protein
MKNVNQIAAFSLALVLAGSVISETEARGKLRNPSSEREAKPKKTKPLELVALYVDSGSSDLLEITEYSVSKKHDGINHKVNLKNTSGKVVVAYEIGLVSFDIFNEHMGTLEGWSKNGIKPGKDQKNVWLTNFYNNDFFLTGYAFVSKVRFSDGMIVECDPVEVIHNIMKSIPVNIDVKDLDSDRYNK